MRQIDATQLAERLDATTFVDVRTPGEHDTVRIPGAVNIPLAMLQQHAPELVAVVPRDSVLVCQSGGRAATAHAALGRNDLSVLTGGIGAWTAADAVVEHGSPRWAMDRQVRLVAGSIVTLSMLTSLRWSRARSGAAFVGAGLTFSAVTNTCTMANVLARLPYNRVPDPSYDDVVACLSERWDRTTQPEMGERTASAGAGTTPAPA